MTIASMDEYLTWMKSEHGYDFYQRKNRARYDTNLTSIRSSIAGHPIIGEIERAFKVWDAIYRERTGSALFMKDPELGLNLKPYPSTTNKTFRLNVLWNRRFPEPPEKGWITPDNVYSRINDLVRTYFVCKFIDGPKFLTDGLSELCKKSGIMCKSYSQERDEGYYAYHFYIL